MGLFKNIKLSNGIDVSYHRIVSINKITNKDEIIEVTSYINQQERQREKDFPNSDIFLFTRYINKTYDENENIKDVYNYLKTTNEFENAEDVNDMNSENNEENIEDNDTNDTNEEV